MKVIGSFEIECKLVRSVLSIFLSLSLPSSSNIIKSATMGANYIRDRRAIHCVYVHARVRGAEARNRLSF